MAETKNVFNGIGVLGIPFRYSVKIAEIMKTVKNKKTGNTYRDALLIAMCSETKLPLCTSKGKRYKDISKIFDVKIINTDLILKYDTPEAIFKKVKIL